MSTGTPIRIAPLDRRRAVALEKAKGSGLYGGPDAVVSLAYRHHCESVGRPFIRAEAVGPDTFRVVASLPRRPSPEVGEALRYAAWVAASPGATIALRDRHLSVSPVPSGDVASLARDIARIVADAPEADPDVTPGPATGTIVSRPLAPPPPTPPATAPGGRHDAALAQADAAGFLYDRDRDDTLVRRWQARCADQGLATIFARPIGDTGTARLHASPIKGFSPGELRAIESLLDEHVQSRRGSGNWARISARTTKIEGHPIREADLPRIVARIRDILARGD
jgi:hypothetical protein